MASPKKSTLGVGRTKPPPSTAVGLMTRRSRSCSSASSHARRSDRVFAVVYGSDASSFHTASSLTTPSACFRLRPCSRCRQRAGFRRWQRLLGGERCPSCRVNDLAGRTPSRVDGGGNRPSHPSNFSVHPSGSRTSPSTSSRRSSALQVGSMGLHVVGFGRVVEIAYRPTNGVPVLEQVSNDVVPDVPVHPRRKFVGV